ncbi:hypothetical protein ACFRJ7_31550 [Streptomyces sp. NPDC056747]|uniref:hypothetical protein n=1 Tax=Streptomyces sp. NPDC056747 TaxID=3345935 RepID=UPI00369E86E1
MASACYLRVRPGGSHHQKLVVLRHPGRPELDVAYVGGIDLCHNRNDDADHRGDRQSLPMATAYGPHPPWHDVQLALRGPAVGDVETVFRERRQDPAPLSRSPLVRLRELARREDVSAGPLPPRTADPAPCGTQAVQLLRTYPNRLLHGYPYAPDGEFSARGYTKALRRARALVYLEDQYLWSPRVVDRFARALSAHRELRLIAVIPSVPSRPSTRPQPAWTPGTRAAVAVRGRRAAFAGTFRRNCPPRSGCSPLHCTTSWSIRTDVRWACGGATRTEGIRFSGPS